MLKLLIAAALTVGLQTQVFASPFGQCICNRLPCFCVSVAPICKPDRIEICPIVIDPLQHL